MSKLFNPAQGTPGFILGFLLEVEPRTLVRKVSTLAIILLVSCFLFTGEIFSEETTIVEAKVSKTQVATGEIFAYTIKVEGEFISPKLKLPEFKNFIIASRSEQRSYIAKSKGMRFEEKLTLNLLCPKPGVFTIEGFSVEDNGKKLTANSVKIEVTGKPLEEKAKPLPYTSKGIDI